MVESTKLYSEIDFRGHETTFAYDSNGRLSGRSNRAGNTTTYSYNTSTRVTTVGMPLSRTWHYTFDPSGRATDIQDPVNPVDTTVTWTSDNEVQRVTEPSGQHIDYIHNTNGYLTSQSDELGDTTTLTYQSFPVDSNDASGNWETGRSIGHISRLTSVVKPTGNSTSSNPTDYTWTYTYTNDTTDHVYQETDPLGNVTTNTWNGDGTIASTTLPSNSSTMSGLGYGDTQTRTTTYNTYDANGLPTKITDAAGGVTQAGYSRTVRWHGRKTPTTAPCPAATRPRTVPRPTTTTIWSAGPNQPAEIHKSVVRAARLGRHRLRRERQHHRQVQHPLRSGRQRHDPETTTTYDAMDRPTASSARAGQRMEAQSRRHLLRRSRPRKHHH